MVIRTARCDTPAVREVLGPEPEVTDANLLVHLGIVEQRANELLQVRAGGGGHNIASAV